jgi:hypothetical protein
VCKWVAIKWRPVADVLLLQALREGFTVSPATLGVVHWSDGKKRLTHWHLGLELTLSDIECSESKISVVDKRQVGSIGYTKYVIIGLN